MNHKGLKQLISSRWSFLKADVLGHATLENHGEWGVFPIRGRLTQ
jgi:hypothetical protein